MEREQIISLAREAGLLRVGDGWTEPHRWGATEVERFAALVAAHEREECAKVCDAKVEAEYATGKVDHNEMGWTQYCAMAIRLREKEQA
jgi:hypothetical protein